MEYFCFQHVVPMKERYRSFTFCEDIGKKRMLKLRRYVGKLTSYVCDEERKLKSQMRKQQRDEDELKEKLKDLNEESEDLSEELDSFKEKVLLAKDELFWKNIHKKHVKEDLTVLKVITNTVSGCIRLAYHTTIQSVKIMFKFNKKDSDLSLLGVNKLQVMF